MMSKHGSQRGFTMAELLVVVAIIAVLVAIAIPVFSGQLEKSREATDIANIRSAYAEVMTSVNLDGQEHASDPIALKQKQDGWQNAGFRDALRALGAIVGEPATGGSVVVEYKLASGAAVAPASYAVAPAAGTATAAANLSPPSASTTLASVHLAAAGSSSGITITFSGAVPGDQATVDAQTPGIADNAKTILLSLAAAERQALKLYADENTDQAMGYRVKWKPDGSFELTKTYDAQVFHTWNATKILESDPSKNERGFIVMVTTINGKVIVGSNLRFDPETKTVTALPYHVKHSQYGKANDLVQIGNGSDRVWNEGALIY